ncbi:MAG: hypothetical protein R3339_10110 [Thermodesulfobacteriota bacterium]|nr:hypothetical protein [Thermodesulfobacteriota bacterium]
MDILDKRIINRMQEDEVQNYQEELLKQLPDLSENCEQVDISLLLSQIPSREKREALPDGEEEVLQETSQEEAG